MLIQDKRVFITGGSSGIGLALVEGFLKNGASVAFSYRSADALSRPEVKVLLASYPDTVAIRMDFYTEVNIDELLKETAEKLGGEINVLVNNVAVFSRSNFLQTAENDFREILHINTIIPFLLIKAFSNALIKEKMPGNIINISSLSSTMARSKMTAYQCSKAAMDMLSNSAAYELAQYNIRSNIIAPGLTETSANQNQRDNQPGFWEERSALIPLGRAGKPKDFVSAALFLSDTQSSWISGSRIVIDGGLSTF